MAETRLGAQHSKPIDSFEMQYQRDNTDDVFYENTLACVRVADGAAVLVEDALTDIGGTGSADDYMVLAVARYQDKEGFTGGLQRFNNDKEGYVELTHRFFLELETGDAIDSYEHDQIVYASSDRECVNSDDTLPRIGRVFQINQSQETVIVHVTGIRQ